MLFRSIEPGHTILEPTSGNTGIALAMICRRKGYPLKVVMPDNVTEERTELLRMYGAEIVYSEGAKGSNGAVEVALEMAQEPGYYMPYQYGNEANPNAHYYGTAVEILEELDEVTAFVGGLGTGGTLMGNGRRFKEHDPETKIVAAADGVVTDAGRESGYGNVVRVRHEFGFETVYAHLSKIRVKVGQQVSRGVQLGDMGSTGRSTGSHLHYEVRVNGNPQNPMTYLEAAKDVF